MRLAYLIFILFSLTSSAQWFFSTHYYEIRHKSGLIYAKGKPSIDGEFTVFNKWPENLEWRVKTKDVRFIKDIGPLSPEQIKEEKLEAILNDAIQIDEKGFTTEQLKQARSVGYSDNEIWEYWIKVNPKAAKAKSQGIPLDIAAKAWDEFVSRNKK